MERLKAPFLGSFSSKTTETGLAVSYLGTCLRPVSSCVLCHLASSSGLMKTTFLQGVAAVKKDKQQGPLPRGQQKQSHPLCHSPGHDASGVLTVARYALQGAR
jgi:hypothetical protein